jgi:hypothetical protein
MKTLPFLVLGAVLALTACSTPEERARAERQRRIEDAAEDRRRAEEDRQRAAEDLAEDRRRAAEDAARLRIYEEEYARSLGKTRSQLTREERAWVRERYF